MSDILQDFSPLALSQALDANEIAFWTLFKNYPAMQMHDKPEISWFETGIPHDVFNRILQVRFEGDTLPPAIERIVASFQARRIPFLWHRGPSSRPAHLDTLLLNQGFIHYETEPAMAVDLLTFNENISTARDIMVHLVLTPEQLRQWIQVWEFESSEAVIDLWFSLYSSVQLNQESPLHLYIGLQDGKPVATSAVFMAAGVASIGPLGTLPSIEGKVLVLL